MNSLILACQIVISIFFFDSSYFPKDIDSPPEIVGGIAELVKHIKYPEEARSNGIQGKVLVNVTIEKDGSILECKILEGIGSGCNEAAIYAIKQCKFIPGKHNGENVKAKIVIPIMFKLDSCNKK
jgi:protein TonB